MGEEARFDYPTGIAINQRNGTLYISDYCNHKIRVVTPNGMKVKRERRERKRKNLQTRNYLGNVSTLAGSTKGDEDGSSKEAKFNHPLGIWFDERDQSLLVCDNDNNKIRRVTLEGMAQ